MVTSLQLKIQIYKKVGPVKNINKLALWTGIGRLPKNIEASPPAESSQWTLQRDQGNVQRSGPMSITPPISRSLTTAITTAPWHRKEAIRRALYFFKTHFQTTAECAQSTMKPLLNRVNQPCLEPYIPVSRSKRHNWFSCRHGRNKDLGNATRRTSKPSRQNNQV
jgi:hypothetical protein